MPETNVVPIQCPNCGTQYQTPVRTVIDVGQQPQLRQAFLSGQINLAVCPKCQAGGMLEVPLVYHDPAAEFLAVYFPSQLNIPEMEKQRMIGDLTQGLMRSLPPEQRKGYFLSPRQFATRQSLMDAVLGTMGISQEELDRQRKKMKMVEQFTVMADDPKGLQMLAKGQDAQLDYEFFSILDGMSAQAQAMGDTKTAERMQLLRNNLMPLTTFGRKAAKQQAAVESLKDLQVPGGVPGEAPRRRSGRGYRDRRVRSPSAGLQLLRSPDGAHRGQPGRREGSPDEAARATSRPDAATRSGGARRHRGSDQSAQGDRELAQPAIGGARARR